MRPNAHAVIEQRGVEGLALAEETVLNAIHGLLRRRKADHIEVAPHSDLYEDLQFDSLEIAELSVMLEDDLGHDPYTAGFIPRTVGELVGFYD